MDNVAKFPTKERVVEFQSNDIEDNIDALKDFIDTERDVLLKSVAHIENIANELYEVDVHDKRFRSLLASSKRESIGIEGILQLWNAAKEPTPSQKRFNEITDRYYAKSDNLKYFVLTNQKGNRVHILAPDPEVARLIAWWGNRITDRTNGKVRQVQEGEIQRLPYAQAIEAALRECKFATELDVMGDRLVSKREKKIY